MTTNDIIRPGDHVQVDDRKSGYSGCVLDYIRQDGNWHICRNDTCPRFFTTDNRGAYVGAVRVRSVRLYRRWPPIA